MKVSHTLTLHDAQTMGAAAQAEADRNGWHVTIAICDAGGHALWLQRMDGAPRASAQIAPEKARTCVLNGKPSGASEKMINDGRFAALSMPFVALEGGEPVSFQGEIIGAVGVSGVRSDQDAQVARAGAAALPTTPDAASQA